MELTRAQEQRIAQLEECFNAETNQKLDAIIGMLSRLLSNQQSDDQFTLNRSPIPSVKAKGSGSDHFERSLNEEESVETEVATEPIETKHGIVKPETNANMILANLEEESTSQFQVPVSDLEHGLRFRNASSIVCEDSQYVVGCDELCDLQKSISQVSHVKEMEEFPHQSTNGNGENVAHQVFGKMSQQETLGIKKKTKGFKSWRFKFKQRVATRESKSGFEVNMKHNQSKEYPCLFLAGNVATLGHILFESEMKFNGCRMFLQLLRNVIHKKRQRKTPKYHKSWKFRFKNMDLQRIMTQLDTQHFIFRWDSDCILQLSTVVHHLETSPKQSSLAIDALTDFGVDVILFHGEQQLGCRVVMLHFKNKGRFRRFQSFSRLNNAERSLKVTKLERKKKKLCYKTWMFKYKVDEEGQGILQSRTGWVQEVFAVICFLLRRHLHLNLDCEEAELAGRKRNQGLFIRLHNNLKQQRCPKSWMFKFKTDSKSARTNHILHQEKKPSKSPKSWKFKFKSENLRKMEVLFQHSHGLSNRLHRQDLQDLQQFITFGEVTLQLEHKWKFKGKGREVRKELCHTSWETIQEGPSHCFLLVAAAYLTIPMQFGSEGNHVWHRWKARYSQNFDRVWDPGVSSFFITLRSRFLEGEGFDIGNEMKRVAREKEISCWTRGRR